MHGRAALGGGNDPAALPDGFLNKCMHRLHRYSADRARIAASKYGLFGLWAIVIAIFGILEPGTFLTAQNFENMFNSQAALLILAFALLPTLIAGELDLSVAGTMTIASTLTGQLNGVDHWPIGLAVVVGIASGITVGLVNAILTVKAGVNSLVVTLGMATFLVGVALAVSNSNTIGGVSPAAGNFLNSQVAVMNIEFYIAAAIALVMWYVFRHTGVGRQLLYVGANATAARFVGIKVGRRRFAAFIAGGCLAGIAGVLVVVSSGGIDPTALQTLLLPAFASVFLGTAVIDPGRPNVIGTCVASLFLVTGITGLQLLSGSNWVSNVFYGGILIVAVVISRAFGASVGRVR